MLKASCEGKLFAALPTQGKTNQHLPNKLLLDNM